MAAGSRATTALILIALGLSATSGEADAAVKRCDFCKEDHHFSAEASLLGPGTHLIYNIESGTVQQWTVTEADDSASSSMDPATPEVKTQKGVPPAGAVEEVTLANRLYHASDAPR